MQGNERKYFPCGECCVSKSESAFEAEPQRVAQGAALLGKPPGP